MPVDRLGYANPESWFSDWRRQWRNTHLINLDSVEYCGGCGVLLALLEITKTRAEHKPSTILRKMAGFLGVPAFVVQISEWTTPAPFFRVKPVAPAAAEAIDLGEDEMGEWLLDLHDHGCGRIRRGFRR